MNGPLRQPQFPKLRFPEFQGEWKATTIRQLLHKLVRPVNVAPGAQYRQIGVRSHGKGLFHKEAVLGSELGEKRVFWVQPNALVINIVFAWEQAIALTTDKEAGMVASHRFPMFSAIDRKSNVQFMYYFFMRRRGRDLLSQASPGGAGRNKTLGQNEFFRIGACVPEVKEQTKIASFLNSLEEKYSLLLQKRDLLVAYKKGIMQGLFSQNIRFKREDGKPFPDWRTKRLSEILRVKGVRNHDRRYGKKDVLSVSREHGIVNQIEHLGRSYAGQSVESYHVVEHGDIVYTKSPLKDNPYGIIKGNKGNPGIVSTLYAVYEVNEGNSFEYIDAYFSHNHNINKYLAPLVHKGAKNDMKISNERVLSDSISVPCFEEQRKISQALSSIDRKIELVSNQAKMFDAFRKSAQQQMFV